MKLFTFLRGIRQQHQKYGDPSSAVEGLDEASENHAFHRGPTLCEQ